MVQRIGYAVGIMLKHLAILAAFVTLASSIWILTAQSVPSNTSKKGIIKGDTAVKEQPETGGQREDHDSAKVPSVVVQVEIPNVESNHADSHEDEAAKELARYTFGLMVFTLGLVLVGVIHASHLHKLGKAATDNAKSALLNAQAVINAERPWILVKGEATEGMASSAVIANNCGRTPARFTKFSPPKSKIIPSGSDLPLPVDYGKILPFDGPVILLPDGRMPIRFLTESEVREICGTDDTWNRVQSGGLELYIFGILYYEDLLNSPDKATHETKWCCRYLPGVDEPRNFLVLNGSRGYNDYT